MAPTAHEASSQTMMSSLSPSSGTRSGSPSCSLESSAHSWTRCRPHSAGQCRPICFVATILAQSHVPFVHPGKQAPGHPDCRLPSLVWHWCHLRSCRRTARGPWVWPWSFVAVSWRALLVSLRTTFGDYQRSAKLTRPPCKRVATDQLLSDGNS